MASVPKRVVIAFLALLSYACMSFMDANSRNAINFVVNYGEYDLLNGTFVINCQGIDYDTRDLKSLERGGRTASYLGAASSILAGAIATKCGAVTAFGMGIGLNAIVNIFTPIALATNAYLFIFGRFIRTFAHVLSIVAMSGVWCKWAPSTERSTLYTFTYVGLSASMLIYDKFASFIDLEIGWPYVFHITGAVAIILTIMWMYCVKNDPDDDETLSSHERRLLADSSKHVIKTRTPMKEVPWKKLLSSAPIWGLCIVAIFNSHLIFTYSYDFLTTQKHIDDTTKQTLKRIANLNSIPSLLAAGYVADLLKNKFQYHETKIRKIYICSAYIIGALLLFLFYWSRNLIPFIIFFSAVELARSFIDAAVLVNAIDISPQYASLISGIYWTFHTVGALLNNSFISNVTENGDLTSWEFCFVLYIILYLFSAVVYYICGSGQVQPWNKAQVEQTDIDLNA